jgi:hypothetical protein
MSIHQLDSDDTEFQSFACATKFGGPVTAAIAVVNDRPLNRYSRNAFYQL